MTSMTNARKDEMAEDQAPREETVEAPELTEAPD